MPKFYRYLLPLLLLVAALAARAQNRRADSLSAAIRYNPRGDMGRVRPGVPKVSSPAIIQHKAYQTSADSLLAVSRRRGDRWGEVNAHMQLFSYYAWNLGQEGPALQHMHQAQALAAQLGKKAALAWLIRIEGHYQMGRTRYEQGIQLMRRALALTPPGQRGMRADMLSYLAQMYGLLGDESAAAYYERLSAAELPQVRPDSLAYDTCFHVLGRLAESNISRKHWAVGVRYYQRALARARYAHDFELLEHNAGLASAYVWQNQPRKALRCLRPYLAKVVHDTVDTNWGAMRLVLAAAYYENHQPDSALLHGRVALALAQRMHSNSSGYWACWALAGAAAEQHDYARAWHYQRLSLAYQDTMHVEESGRRVEFARHNTTVAQQQARIALLTKDQELARLRQQRTAIGLVLLAVLLAAGTAAAVYGVRQRQRRREAALRRKLAADLHDDVGSLLTRLSLESSLLSEGLRPPQEQQRQLAALVSVSQQALRQMRDVVWSIRPDHDTMPHLLDQMREHGYDLLAAASLEFDFSAEAGVAQAELTAQARQHLYLIYKEALHNAVKHACGASTLRVRLALDGPALCLTVRDDGAGADSLGRPSGLGISSMRQRAEAVGGTVAYDTAPGQGFTVAARLPLAGHRLRAMPAPAGSAVPQAPGSGWLGAVVD